MKKEYIAPDLYFESFVLSESIAAGCGELAINTIKALMYEGNNYFTSGDTPNNYANYKCQNDGTTIWEGYCYTAGGSNQLFLS